jgi:hypothetical protein
MSAPTVPTFTGTSLAENKLREALSALEPTCSYESMTCDEITWEVLDTERCTHPAKWIVSVICKNGHAQCDAICDDHRADLTTNPDHWMCDRCNTIGVLQNWSAVTL